MTDPESKLYYRSEEYKALRKHRRQMKKKQNPNKKKETKTRKDWNAKYYRKKKAEWKERTAEPIDDQQHQVMELDEPDELQMLKDENDILHANNKALTKKAD